MSNGAILLTTTFASLAVGAALFPVFVGFDHGWHGLSPAIFVIINWF